MTSAILVIIWLLPAGSAGVDQKSGVTFQEFNSMKQCQYVASIIKDRTSISQAFCVNK